MRVASTEACGGQRRNAGLLLTGLQGDDQGKQGYPDIHPESTGARQLSTTNVLLARDGIPVLPTDWRPVLLAGQTTRSRWLQVVRRDRGSRLPGSQSIALSISSSYASPPAATHRHTRTQGESNSQRDEKEKAKRATERVEAPTAAEKVRTGERQPYGGGVGSRPGKLLCAEPPPTTTVQMTASFAFARARCNLSVLPSRPCPPAAPWDVSVGQTEQGGQRAVRACATKRM
ncbi:hypothetical protein HPB50_014651 [Hyalomma asiaticum]|uniref:Uncharacterized protein n=1 Tax=Hyalomma asiaticum TaxID=266040 RepID=A0ACB7S9D8_HYAAI|nr:hypothetical protein HPB50_014651 [Hyalomma asiaticum]